MSSQPPYLSQPGQAPPPGGQQYYTPPAAKPRKKRRVFMWVFFAIQLIFLIWVIAGGTSTGGSIHSSTVA